MEQKIEEISMLRCSYTVCSFVLGCAALILFGIMTLQYHQASYITGSCLIENVDMREEKNTLRYGENWSHTHDSSLIIQRDDFWDNIQFGSIEQCYINTDDTLKTFLRRIEFFPSKTVAKFHFIAVMYVAICFLGPFIIYLVLVCAAKLQDIGIRTHLRSLKKHRESSEPLISSPMNSNMSSNELDDQYYDYILADTDAPHVHQIQADFDIWFMSTKQLAYHGFINLFAITVLSCIFGLIYVINFEKIIPSLSNSYNIDSYDNFNFSVTANDSVATDLQWNIIVNVNSNNLNHKNVQLFVCNVTNIWQFDFGTQKIKYYKGYVKKKYKLYTYLRVLSNVTIFKYDYNATNYKQPISIENVSTGVAMQSFGVRGNYPNSSVFDYKQKNDIGFCYQSQFVHNNKNHNALYQFNKPSNRYMRNLVHDEGYFRLWIGCVFNIMLVIGATCYCLQPVWNRCRNNNKGVSFIYRDHRDGSRAVSLSDGNIYTAPKNATFDSDL